VPGLELPFEAEENEAHDGDPFACALYKMLPGEMQDSTRDHVYLLNYLHSVPVQDIGVPEFYTELEKGLGDKANKNLIYPVKGGLYIHVIDDPEGGRGYYIAIEPKLDESVDENKLLVQVESQLLQFAERFEGADTPEELQVVLEKVLEDIYGGGGGGGSKLPFFGRGGGAAKPTVKLDKAGLEVLKYLVVREKIGLGILEPLIRDLNIEDISCSGLGSIFIEHKVFDSLRTAATFANNEELDEFVIRLSERIKKPVTFRNPIVDATLPDGSRINLVYGEDVSKRGSNFTIRKFAENPISIIQLVEWGSLTYEMAAYMSLIIGEGLNVFVSGETASGKTTLLNALNTFMHPDAKVVSIEDTPELQVPHPNWIQEATRAARPGEEGSGVDMFDLLKAALRQRPNEILIGEIRGEEGLIAFGAMQTGHACMATFHASTVEKLIQRLTGAPISVPKAYVDNLNVVVIQTAVKLPNGKLGRRAVSIAEIISYDSLNDAFSFVEVFKWDPIKDVFEFTGHMNSYMMEHKIAPARGIPNNKKRQIYALITRRAKVMEKLAEKGINEFHEFYRVIAKAQREGIF
jgi:archaeal flagellar protein FlaI